MARMLKAALSGAIIIAFAVMVIAAILQVASRYVFNSPLGWTEELAKFLMVWWTFLTVGLLAWRGKLLAIDALLLALGPRSAHGLLAVAQGLSAAGIGWLTLLGARLVELAGDQITPSLDVPYAWIYLSLPVGLGLATAGFAWRAAHHGRLALRADAPHPVVATDRSDV